MQLDKIKNSYCSTRTKLLSSCLCLTGGVGGSELLHCDIELLHESYANKMKEERGDKMLAA